jgi:hypothetical protein
MTPDELDNRTHLRSTIKAITMTYTELQLAFNAGNPIQANRGTEDEPKWETIEGQPMFSCPPHLYRVEPQK